MNSSRSLVVVTLLLAACASDPPRRPASAPPCGNPTWGCNAPPNSQNPNYGNSQPNTYPSYPAANNGPGPYAQPTTPVGPAAPSTNGPTVAPSIGLNPPPFLGVDPISAASLEFLTNRSGQVVAELIANLDATTQSRVRNIPIVYDSNQSEVNAYASCTQSGKSAVTVTNGLELVLARLAEAEAVDEIFGTRRVDEYIGYVAKNQKQGQPVLAPPAGFYTAAQLADPRKQSREQQVFDEEIGFVLGHEMAHHYLNHLPCTSILPLDAAEVGQVVTSVVPMFNQPNESAADVAGVNNILRTGAQRQGYHFTEGGALLTMRFFAGLDQSSPIDIFTFERTHPPPSVREPVIRTAAQVFNTTKNVPWPWGG